MLKSVTDNVLYLPPNAATDRPVLAAVLGSEGVLMIDAGNSPAHAALFLDALAAATHRAPDWVVLTHWHWDHTFGLSRLTAPAIAHTHTTANLSRLQGLAWDDAALAQRVARGDEIAFCAEHIAKEYGDNRDIRVVLPDMTFDRLMTLQLGGVTCELHWLQTDHTDDAVAIYVREERVLFLGDALGPNIYAPAPTYSPANVQAMMAQIRAFPVDWYVESHSAPVRPAGFWAENRILEVVADLMVDGVTERGRLLRAVERRLSGELPGDYVEVVDQFLASR